MTHQSSRPNQDGGPTRGTRDKRFSSELLSLCTTTLPINDSEITVMCNV
uniref:Uncharacterized protein n=1 Tax=Lepeophtheirus salmonis TaxID=72036 RepID=A0A0K2ULC3_LEPSM